MDVARFAPEMRRKQLLLLECHVAAAGNLGGGRTTLQDWPREDENKESRRATNRIICAREGCQRAPPPAVEGKVFQLRGASWATLQLPPVYAKAVDVVVDA